MNILYIIAGVALSIFGIWQAIVKGRSITGGKPDLLGANIQLLGAGIMAIMIGVYLILHYI
jgi:hypothetical protein